jgi:basic membrane protein A
LFLKKSAVLFAAALLIAGGITGCTKKNQDTAEAKLVIGLVTDVGGVNDQSFNQTSWEGLERFGKDNPDVKVSYQESKTESDYEPNIEYYADQDAALIWGIGFMMGETIQKAGTLHPDRQFAIVDFAYDDPAVQVPNNNVTGVMFAQEECSFLVGYIAGKMTKTGIVGHVNGIPSPIMEAFAVGYYAGVLTANPDVKILGQYANAFGDPAGGKAIANQFYSENADIIYAAAGATGNGVIEAAKEQKKWVIGVDIDQNYIAPDNVLTSALKRVDNAAYDISKQVKDGGFKGGGTALYNLKNGGVGYAKTGNHIPVEIIAEVDQIAARIISGEQKVPGTAAEIEALFPGKYNLKSVSNQK